MENNIPTDELTREEEDYIRFCMFYNLSPYDFNYFQEITKKCSHLSPLEQMICKSAISKQLKHRGAKSEKKILVTVVMCYVNHLPALCYFDVEQNKIVEISYNYWNEDKKKTEYRKINTTNIF